MNKGYYIGLMSGTSMDGIDAALVDIRDERIKLVASHEHPWPETLRDELRQLARTGQTRLQDYGRLDGQCGRLFAEAVNHLLGKAGVAAEDIIAVGSHGQTLWHSPDGADSFTLQIGDPNRIVELTGITTVADLRRRDMAAGGQGAPLVPAFHQAVLRHPGQNRVILNIGGIANVTVLPATTQADGVTITKGFDTGPGNCLLDGWIRKHQGKTYDADGSWAGSGTVLPDLLQQFLDDPYFADQPPKSTGTEYFSPAWLDNHLAAMKTRSAEDVQATLLELTAGSITNAIRAHAPATESVYVCGGGVHNAVLLNRIRTLLAPVAVESTATQGIPPDWMEAMAFAWLAQQTLANKPGNLPSATGAKHPVILGGIYSR